MSDALDEHPDNAFASLDNVPLRELEAIAALLERRRDELGSFASVFRAFARRGGGEPRWGRWHLGDCVSRGGDELADRLADAPASFGGECATRSGRVSSVW